MNIARLQRLITRYLSKEKQVLDQELQFYQKLSFDHCLEAAGLATDENGKRQDHQRRIKSEILERVKDTLIQKTEEIKNCKTFGDIYFIVESCSEKGYAELSTYDTALRIGSNLNIFPEKVYLHRGTLGGARYLLSKPYPRVASPLIFPESLQRIQAHHIENFLCIYKGALAGCI